MNKQQIFDTVLAHARAQKIMGINCNTGRCAYHTKSGLKCFIGAVIPDNLYNPSFEGVSIADLLTTIDWERQSQNTDLQQLFDEVPILFLEDLQELHDAAGAIGERDAVDYSGYWEARLSEFAQRHGLKYLP